MTTNEGFWEAGIYGTADRLNASLLQLGTLAARPAAGQVGRMYMVTDTATKGSIYRDNGTAWVEVLTTDAAAGTASLRTLSTTSTTAAAGNHGHSFADLTAAKDDVDEGGAAGSGEAHLVMVTLAASASVNIDITHTPTTDAAVVAFAAALVQGVSGTVNYLDTDLLIDGTSVDSESTIAAVASQASLIHLTGMRQRSGGAITIRFTINNGDAVQAAEYVAWVSALSVTVS